MAAPAPPKFNTIYEALDAWRGDFFKGDKPLDTNKAQLYDAIARFLAEFAIADVRHDFTTELNIVIDAMTKDSIGLFQIRQICGAYYQRDSPRFKALFDTVRDNYLRYMTSDTTAKAYVEKRTVEFFSRTFPDLREEHFEDSVYNKLLQQSHTLLSAPYSTDTEKNKILEKLNPADRPIILDAQMGNPTHELFSYSKSKNINATYLFNFASVLDAAEKLMADVHTYMKVYKQKSGDTSVTVKIPPYIGAYMYENTVSAPIYHNSDWKIKSTFNIDGKDYERYFSSTDMSSVNELGIIRTRGITAAQREAQESALLTSNINKIQVSVNHQYKSTGDRYQVYSVSRSFPYGSDFYKLHGDLRAQNPPGPAANLPPNLIVSPIVITNDILNKYQCYFFQVNTLFTESKALSFFDYIKGEPLEVDGVRALITDSTISRIHEIITRLRISNIIVGTPQQLLSSIYDCAAAKRIQEQCESSPFLKGFLNPRPPTTQDLKAMINEKNKWLINSYLTSDILTTLRESVNWTQDQRNDFVFKFTSYIALNIPDIYNLASIGGHTVSAYSSLIAHTQAIQSDLSDMFIEKHNDILAHLLFQNIGTSRFIDKVYTNGMFDTLINFRRDKILGKAISRACNYHHYSGESAQNKLMPIIELVKRYIPTGAPSYLEELTTKLQECDELGLADNDFSKVYSMIQPHIVAALIFKLVSSVSKLPDAKTRLLREILVVNGFQIAEPAPVAVAPPPPPPVAIAPPPPPPVAVAPPPPPPIVNARAARARERAKRQRNTQQPPPPSNNVAPERPAKLPRRQLGGAADILDAFTPLRLIVESEKDEKSTDPPQISISATEMKREMVPPEDMPKVKDLQKMTVFTPVRGFYGHLPSSIAEKAKEVYNGINSIFYKTSRSSRSTSPIYHTSLYELCKKKLELMCMIIGKPRMEFAGIYLFSSAVQLNRIYQDMLATRGRSRSVTLSVPSINTASAATLTADSFQQNASTSSQISVVMEKEKARDFIHKQLLSFFFAGFSRGHDAIAVEKQILGQYLPVIVRDEISSTHNQLFWHPLFNRVTASYDEFAALYKRKIQEIATPIKRIRYSYTRKIKAKVPKKRQTSTGLFQSTRKSTRPTRSTRKTKRTVSKS